MNPPENSTEHHPGAGAIRLVVGPDHAGLRLDQFLAAVTEASRRSVRRLIADGTVWRNGQAVRVQSRSLELADVVDVLSPPADLVACPQTASPTPSIIHEDRWLLVADKPPGVLSQPAEDSGELALDQQMMLYLAARDGRRPFLRLVHRIDRLTSGAVLFARTAEATASLAKAWRDQEVERTYLVVVRGRPSGDTFEIDRPIGRDPEHHWRFRAAADGRTARTLVRVVGEGRGRSVVECRLLTGRTHQVRVHLAAEGYPVVGDRLYGAPAEADVRRPLLHALRLVLPHPRSGDRLSVQCPLPEDLASVLPDDIAGAYDAGIIAP